MSRSRLFPTTASLLAVLAVLAGACSSGERTAASSDDGDPATEAALFDSDVVHDVEVTYDQADYDAMIETFVDSRDKEWIEATVTIDGTTYEHVGLRLKGNSSLGGLAGGGPGGGGPGGGRPGGGGPGGDDFIMVCGTRGSGAVPSDGATMETPPGGGPGGSPIGSASKDSPEKLPWLIRLDKFVEGQNHQGYEDLVIRSNGSETSLNEAVALDLLEAAGLASQEAAATRFSVNGGDEVLRLAIEHPDDTAWQDANFDDEGALYKAESTGDWSYRGEDPAEYEEAWDQEGGSDVTDLSPLTELLRFLDESDDGTFAAELPERLDVERFAKYLAMMKLVENFDDIDGPGNNAYLWYDVETQKFTVVPWDMNLAFGGLGADPDDFPRGAEPAEECTARKLPENFDPSNPPEDFDPSKLPEVDPGDLPEGADRPELAGGRENVLVQRFHENTEFEALYREQLEALRRELFDAGTASEVLASWVNTLTSGATDLVDEATIESEAETIEKVFIKP